MKKYTLTDEHRAQLPAWRDKWIANAMSTAPMTDEEREICRDAVRRLYQAANLPPPSRIVFVPSPFVLRFAGGFASAIWYLRKSVDSSIAKTATYAATRDATDDATGDATGDATDAATHDATRDATRDATHDATRDATYAATHAATHEAMWAATRDATYAATRDATRDATHDATRDATRDATYAATWYRLALSSISAVAKELLGTHQQFGLQCAQGAYQMWQGGNQWSAWESFLSFFREIAKLPIDYSKYDAWQQLALHSGPRIVHSQFCMISDRPRTLLVDEQNRPHCADGPFCKWSDGSALYSYHGVRVPWTIIEQPHLISAKAVLAEPNAEIRRVMIERMGIDRFAQDAGLKAVQEDDCGKLYRLDDETTFVEVVNATREADGTFKRYFLAAKPNARSAADAVADTFGVNEATYRALRAAGMTET